MCAVLSYAYQNKLASVTSTELINSWTKGCMDEISLLWIGEHAPFGPSILAHGLGSVTLQAPAAKPRSGFDVRVA